MLFKNPLMSVFGSVLFALLLPTPGAAQSGSVQFYGLAHLSVDQNDAGSGSEFVVASNSSRLGIRGGWAVGDDQRLVFQYEPGVDLTGRGENDGNGPGRFDTLLTEERDWFVGVETERLGIKLGRLGILNHWLYDFDPFADLVGDLGNLWGATGIPGRADRVAMLEIRGSDTLSGTLQWSPEGSDEPRLAAGKLSVNTDSIRVNISVLRMDVFGSSETQSAFVVTGDYSLSSGLLGFGLQVEEDIFGLSGNDRESLMLGYTQPLGDGMLKLMYTHSSSDRGMFDGQQWSAGYDLSLNKNALIYGAVAYVHNDSLSQFPANGYGHGLAVTPPAGEYPFSLSLGFLYQFAFELIN